MLGYFHATGHPGEAAHEADDLGILVTQPGNNLLLLRGPRRRQQAVTNQTPRRPTLELELVLGLFTSRPVTFNCACASLRCRLMTTTVSAAPARPCVP